MADQVCKELKSIPIKKDERSYIAYTHDEHEEIRLVESFVSNYKDNLVYRVSAIVNNQLLLNGRFNIEIDCQVVNMKNQKKKDPNKKKYRKTLKKVEKRLMQSLNSLTR